MAPENGSPARRVTARTIAFLPSNCAHTATASPAGLTATRAKLPAGERSTGGSHAGAAAAGDAPARTIAAARTAALRMLPPFRDGEPDARRRRLIAGRVDGDQQDAVRPARLRSRSRRALAPETASARNVPTRRKRPRRRRRTLNVTVAGSDRA